MVKKRDPFETKLETGFGGGGKSQIGGAPSSSLRGSQRHKGPRPTEPPKSKQELRELSREAARQPPDYAKRAARARKFGIGSYAK